MVLDACALIAFFNDEPGADIVAEVLHVVPVVEMAAINLLEIAYDAVRSSGQPQSARDVLETVSKLPISIRRDIDDDVLEMAAGFKARFRISLADSVALAVATVCDAPLVTCDHHEFDAIESTGIARFIWIR